MIFLFEDSKRAHPVGRMSPRVAAPGWVDVIAISLLALIGAAIFYGAGEMRQSLAALNESSITLDPWRLAAMGISHTSMQRIWRKHGLKPDLVRGFIVSLTFVRLSPAAGASLPGSALPCNAPYAGRVGAIE